MSSRYITPTRRDISMSPNPNARSSPTVNTRRSITPLVSTSRSLNESHHSPHQTVPRTNSMVASSSTTFSPPEPALPRTNSQTPQRSPSPISGSRTSCVSPSPAPYHSNALAGALTPQRIRGTGEDYLQPTMPKGKASEARASKGNNAVNVSVRTRPHDASRDGSDTRSAVLAESETEVRLNRDDGRGKDTQIFTFDNVFNAGQDEVFDCIGKPMLRNAFDGYNVTLFAYGQTGSGKTHSVLGPKNFRPNSPEEGFMFRFIRGLLGYAQLRLDQDDPHLTIRISLSMLEVYNEQVHDLLEQKSSSANFTVLDVKESFNPKEKGTFYVKDVSIHTVFSEERAQELIRKGFEARSVDAHNMNKESSRSHCVTVIRMQQTYSSGSKQNLDSVMYIVDLAGSENAERVGSASNEKMAKEAKNINLSLTNLSIVLRHLSEKQPGKPPVRNSKLTQILSNSFGGNARTWMLACLSPSMVHCAESASTLAFAANAKKIENQARVNASLSGEEKKLLQQCKLELMQAMERIKELEEENERLRSKSGHAGAAGPMTSRPLPAGMVADSVGLRPGKDVYLGRCRLSLQNVALGLPATSVLALFTDNEELEGASLTVNTWVPSEEGSTAPAPTFRTPEEAQRALKGKRFDLCVCVVSASDIPEPYTARVYCRYAFRKKENRLNQTIEAHETSNPRWDFRKRFAFPEFDDMLRTHLCSSDTIIFEVIGYKA